MVKNNLRTVPAANFARKDKQQRQINKPKEQELAKSKKQAENFAEKYNSCDRWKNTLIVERRKRYLRKVAEWKPVEK